MQITAQMIKELREATGAGPLDCKKALEGNDGDMQKAMDYLREKGLARAVKKLGATERATNEGLIEVYQHHDKRLAVLVEVNCETDFVAQTEPFRRFAKDVALQIANMAPEYVRIEDVPAAVIAAEKEIQLKRVLEEGKPQNVAEKIVEGRMKKFYEELCLMEQPFIKDDAKTIAQLLQETVAAVGERVEIRRFSRFAIEKGGPVGGA
ncbi:MAG: translation elongation factor Ts [Chloroflexi bacterium]|nr:translation elongation factor Ts [Chloroflexota bacterium]